MTAGEGFGAERATQADGASEAEARPLEADVTPPENTAAPAQGRSAALEEITARPLAEHPDGYERLHDELRSALAEIDDA